MSYTYPGPTPMPMPVPEVRETLSGKALHNAFGTGAFLMAAIMYSCAAVIAFFTLFFPTAGLPGIVNMILGAIPMDELGLSSSEVYEILEKIAPYTRASGFVALIPTLLTCLALWLTYGSAKKVTPIKGTAGLTIMQIFVVLDLIGVILAAVLAIILMIPVLSGMKALDSAFELNGLATGLMVATFVVLLIFLFFAIFFNIKLLNLYGGAKKLARNEKLIKKASLFVIVISVIGVIFNGISLLIAVSQSLLTFATVPTVYAFVTPLSSLFSFLYSLFLVISFGKLRSEEEKLMDLAKKEAAARQQQAAMYQNPPMQPPYQQVPQQAQAPYQQQAPAYQAPAYQNPYQQPYRSPYQPANAAMFYQNTPNQNQAYQPTFTAPQGTTETATETATDNTEAISAVTELTAEATTTAAVTTETAAETTPVSNVETPEE